MALAEQLTRALERAGIPVISVSIGSDDDRATWKVLYRPLATAAQRASGASIIETFNPNADPEWEDEQRQSQLDGQKLVKAVAIWTAQKLGVPLATARQDILSIYRNL